MDDVNKQKEVVQREKEDLQHHYQSRLKGYQDEVNNFYFRKDHEVEKEKIAYENLKKELENKIRSIEEDSAFQHQKVLHEFEETSKVKENEQKRIIEEKDSQIYSYQLKLKMIGREMDMLRSSTIKIEGSMEENKTKTSQLERSLKHKQWELEDCLNMKNLQIQELENTKTQFEKNLFDTEKRLSETTHDKEKMLNEKNEMISKLKHAMEEMESVMRNEHTEKDKLFQEMEMKFQHFQWNKNDLVKDKDMTIKSLENRNEELYSKLNAESELRSKESVSTKLQLEELRSSEGALQQEKDHLRDQVNRLTKDLEVSIERENILQKSKVDMEVEWRKRLETRENQIYHQHEELIRNLKTSKDEVSNELKVQKEENLQQEQLLRILQSDKNKALKVLQNNGIDANKVFSGDSPTHEEEASERDLLQQNEQLRDVIKEMRLEMEQLIQHDEPTRGNQDDDNHQALREKITELEKENEKLVLKLEEANKSKKPPSGSPKSVPVDFSNQRELREHLKELNETICYLRNEKVQLSAFLTSKDAKIRHLHKTILQSEQEKQDLLLQLENMKYNQRSHDQLDHQAIKTMKDRISELELQLEESQSQAQAYFKGALERNLDATQISKKLSQSKFKGLGANSEDQNAVIDTLRKEMKNLKEKLRSAVERIKSLGIERQKLIDVGNRLRAQIQQAKTTHQEEEVPANNKLATHENNEYTSTLQQLRHQGVTRENVHVHINNQSALSSLDGTRTPPVRDTDRGMTSPPLNITSSENSSLREVWKLLEEGSHISIPSSIEVEKDELMIAGKPLERQQKSTLSVRNVAIKLPASKKKQQRNIRNYNERS
uniref:Uncharacterized protein n=1 Tax=Clytia hemisphaerica TaxID=252671 RepID=A0A7M5V707_9CNID